MLKHSEGKLCSYSIFKTYFGLEKYLCILQSFEQRRNFTRFRISSHRLQIERVRYQGALRQDRLCLRCTSGEIDDEKHFLISCSTCPVIRTEMFSRINNMSKLSCPQSRTEINDGNSSQYL
jgi:hypothetical protein